MRVLATALAVLTVSVAAACGDRQDEGERPSASAPMSGAAIPGGGLTVGEALTTDAEGPLVVAGYLVERDGEIRLCSAILESFPPQCGEPSLLVHGAVDRESLGERVSLVGDVEDGVLTIDENTQA